MRNHLDQYFTPPEITRALLVRLNLPTNTRISEPCCGEQMLSTELWRQGLSVTPSDIDPEYDPGGHGTDIFSARAMKLHAGSDWVITNPPYTDAARYVRRALEFAPRVAMLLRLTFLEPCADRSGLVNDLSAVLVTPRVSFFRSKGGMDSVTTAWFIWGDISDTSLRPLEAVTPVELERLLGQLDLFGGAK